MRDYEQLFTKSLHEKLKGKIAGKIFVKVTRDDKLYVHIQSYGNVDCKIYIPDFSERIMNGMSTDYAVYDVVNIYKREIMSRYFYQ